MHFPSNKVLKNRHSDNFSYIFQSYYLPPGLDSKFNFSSVLFSIEPNHNSRHLEVFCIVKYLEVMGRRQDHHQAPVPRNQFPGWIQETDALYFYD